MNDKTARQKILDAAATLFYNDGITATGINTVTAKADVAKMSLYNNFSSKGELVDAYIAARHQEWLDLYQKRLEKTKTAKEAILAVFDAYQDHAEFAYEKGFRGCGLLNAAAEFPANSSGRNAVRQHKEQVEAIVAEHLNRLLKDSQRVSYIASQLSFLLEGSMARAGLEGSSRQLQLARQMAEDILDRECQHD
ncbi:TPA: TetR/AcrR family transcriptional regulator [Acinetobacter baumannii]|jgi:AcrR family transcriptional regulator|uniref:Transcriptional regulator (TetR family) n=1 Tax=Acinetobacter baumannii (strain SDF) TaxID=509170 RepID=B0VMD3_ACIBS|nr:MULTISPECIES: TetR/AcrR family transcriptional regulator [Acinetobacter]CAP02547.1 putative transcriptional regulator (TetR family) [Acinetobacter baumannii SDF]EHU1602845.1 TetR/AcrR family transcriptional regulator [Acinetobacter baumannii]EKT9380600.1 TetR/AcrR family transcriptional regulator [Acinetobacter baumannii]EKU0661581.1 TetR/AcrR family transcriptional regulator [Acinetobacter baumannii]EKU0759243.1 TetR/AcrR family transcriptional regulator [Acinetobacter baumannii]